MFRTLRPPAVYVTEEAERDSRSLRRVERLLACIECSHVHRSVTDAQLDAAMAGNTRRSARKWGEMAEHADPPIVLNTIKEHHTEEQRRERLRLHPALNSWRLHGYGCIRYRQDGIPAWRQREGRICQPAYELHSVFGCPFRCHYCHYNGVLNMMVNIEDFVDHIDSHIDQLAPPQTLYKWDNTTDLNAFEPEYDAVRPLVEYFASRETDYLLLYAGKSDNVDFMLDLEHRGRTIGLWSLSAAAQSTVLEPETAPWDRRVAAMAKCQRAGYPVRCRFSPILPVKGWREENRELIELLFQETKPDVVALCMFGWMDYERAAQCIDLSLLDGQFVDAMKASAPFLQRRRYGPLPHDARAEIYRFLIDEIQRVSPDTPVALCLDTPAMWAEFRDELRQTPDDYVCVCGPTCTPGDPQFDAARAPRPSAAPPH
ncbi:hypothetical protein HQ560_22440 [bacterium]|nr:hypothetical protein [bacterium]